MCFLLLFSVVNCSVRKEPVPILFGKDQCSYCKMTISNPKFGAELITDKGRILKYDAAECMINHLDENAPQYHKLYAVPYNAPKELQQVDSLQFLISPDFRSPMGANLAAFSDTTNLNVVHRDQLIDWQTLLKLL